MNISKRILSLSIISLILISLIGCSKEQSEETPSLSLEEIMETLYGGIDEDNQPNMLMNTEINKENVEYFLGTADLNFTEALASESGITAIAHSVVLVKVDEGENVEKVKETIKSSIDPRKWICVEAEEVIVESKGNLILVIMSSKDISTQIEKNFSQL